VGRVTDIIMDENHPKFSTYGNYSSIGIIFFDTINKSNSGGNNFARPINPNSKYYPLVNELISLYKLPTLTNNSDTYKEDYYYINPINFWNHPHQNASPNYSILKVITQSGDKIKLNSPLNPSQNTFIEKPDIKPLLSFGGDNIQEGRFGNSIRIGNTAKSKSKHKNNWSESGNDGDPIIIIRNGQDPKLMGEGWIPTTEDINEDLSSIYQTSTQKIPILVSNVSYNSYQTKPEAPNLFIQPQIIINSDRVLINAKKDHVLISAQKSVGLSSNASVNVDSPQFIVSSQIIKLGGKNADEALIKGNTLYNKLDTVLDSLITLMKVLEKSQIWPGGVPAPDGITSLAASTTRTQLSGVQKTLKDILSKQNKTI
jgi:hypothetical protein